MDTITIDQLKIFQPGYSGWHVSLFMPTIIKGQETEKNRIRFKNLLQEAEKRLLAKGLRTPVVREMLEPAQGLLEKPGFWQHQSQGLAVFFTAEAFFYYRLPLPFETLVIVSEGFHLKPLLPLFASDGHFYILALSQNQVRLLEGTRYSVDEIELEHIPESIAERLRFTSFNQHLQFHSGTSQQGSEERAGVFHGHDPSDQAKTRILNWFHKVDKTLPDLLIGGNSPLVLAGVEYLFPLYKQANSYQALVEKGIPGNPEELKPDELHDLAWPIVQPIFKQAQEKASDRFHELSDTDQTTIDVKQAVSAAHHGRVADLFVPLGQQIWGAHEPNTNSVQIHEEKKPGDQDLLDLAAIQTILHGGTVYAVEPDQVPEQGPLAAVFRY